MTRHHGFHPAERSLGAAVLDFIDLQKLEFDVETEYLEPEDSLDQKFHRFDLGSISVWSTSATGVLFDRSVLASSPTLDSLEEERYRVTLPDTLRSRRPVTQRPMDGDLKRNAALMAAVAERGMALIDVCGTAELVQVCGPMIDAAWSGALSGQRPGGPDLLRRLEHLAGMDNPDNEAPEGGAELLAFVGLGTLHAALWIAFRAEHYSSPPSHVGRGAWSNLDGTLRSAGGAPSRIIDPRNPPPPDPFEAREQEACARDEAVAASLSPAQATMSLRASAGEQRAILRADTRSALREVRAFGLDW
jgi:hypothetical protein